MAWGLFALPFTMGQSCKDAFQNKFKDASVVTLEATKSSYTIFGATDPCHQVKPGPI